jgi:hypothetical protein
MSLTQVHKEIVRWNSLALEFQAENNHHQCKQAHRRLSLLHLLQLKAQLDKYGRVA